MRAKHLVPNGVTLCNIALGFLAIVSAAEGKFEQGTLFLFFAALCDLFDGKLARMLDASSKFGMELDSLSDAISFGIAPAVLIYLSALRPLGAVGAGIAVLYTLCGALRLARFNVDQNDLAKVTFQGVPIPIAAGYIMSLVMVRASLPIWLIAGGVAAIALLMVSTLKIPKFRKGNLPSFMLAIGIVNFAVFLVRPGAITWHVWNGWNVVMVISNYVMLARRGYLARRRETEELRRAA
ncbi:MAG TPA: CDP-diacylglycerol--serine O-phosphatidyltransferase [Polyangia bacterium]|nr:CDP-diacylglycerol--serine O-phosphatidyltransferase [Polyangia bacterium]